MAFSFSATSTPTKPLGFGLANTSFGFGQQNPSFGLPITSAPSLFGQSGASATNASGFGNFGTTNTVTTSAPTFNFNSGSSTFGPAGFGSGTSAFGGTATFAPSSAPAFSSNTFGINTGQGTFGQSSFTGFSNAAKTTASSLFGGFGQTVTTTQSSFGGGFGTSLGNNFGQPMVFGQSSLQHQLHQSQGTVLSTEDAFINSLFKVVMFNDERDKTLARWNHLQAMWGTGKAFTNQNQGPIELDAQNIISRFKTIGYSKLSGKDNKAGFVALTFNKSILHLTDQKQQLLNTINNIFGNKPNLVIGIESMKELSNNKSQIVIYVDEKLQNNELKRAYATDISSFMNQVMARQQLSNFDVDTIFAFILPDEDIQTRYLETVPNGIDPRVWQQAKKDNPNSKKFIPVPIIGFSGLKWRIKCQEAETEAHSLYLQKLHRQIVDLQQRQNNTSAKIQDHKQKLAELSHRALKIIVKQESTRKAGIAFTPEEDNIRTKLEYMHTLVSAPTQFKGRLNELLSQVRMQRNQWHVGGALNEYAIDKDSTDEVKNFIGMQQNAIAVLVDLASQDLLDLKIIQEGMKKIVNCN